MGYFATHASRHGGISSTQDAQLRGLEEEDPDEGLAEEELGVEDGLAEEDLGVEDGLAEEEPGRALEEAGAEDAAL